MKLTELKQLLRKEILYEQHTQLCESINDSVQHYKRIYMLRENIISKMLSLFLEPKIKKQADAFKNSAEYKELIHQIEQSARSLNILTSKLKAEIDKYDSNIKDMQRSGVNVKIGMDAKQLSAAVAKWRSEKEKEFSKKHKTSLLSINPDWEKYIN
jgi:hypothetical protein